MEEAHALLCTLFLYAACVLYLSRIYPFPLKPEQDGQTRANRPPFTLADIRNAIPKDCFQKNAIKSMFYAVLDLAIVSALAVVAYKINSPWLWPLYWLAQGTMFWALFVIGHDWYAVAAAY